MARSFAIDIDPDPRRAQTPPGWFYTDPDVFDAQREHVFARSWHVVDPDVLEPAGEEGAAFRASPFTLLPGCLDEPLVAITGKQGTRVISNVCTHRGNLVVETPGPVRRLRCRYHGRRFELDGRFRSMPGFDAVENFPSSDDDLRPFASESVGRLLFTSIHPVFDVGSALAPLLERAPWIDDTAMKLDPSSSADYEVAANWALYCDNYLEGFHIPYVHASLNEVLDHGGYRTCLHPHGVMQIGGAREDGDAFDLPSGHPDRGERIAAYYFWLFPATMLNVYPWGLSLNVVEPLSVDRTRVRFRSYVSRPDRREHGAGADLHRVEIEDEAVVEATHRGLRSRAYRRGRYAPAHESGVHHFHRLLSAALASGERGTGYER